MRLKIKYLFFILVLLGPIQLLAQNSNNPFELQHRLPPPAETETPESADTRLIKTDNPFDVVDQPVILAKPNPTKPKPKTEEAFKAPKETAKNYLFWVFFFLFLFFTTVISLSRKRLEQSYQAFANENFARQLHRVNQGSFSLSYFLLYLLFFLNAGIFTFLLANYYGANLPQNFAGIAMICAGIGLLFLLKHLLLSFLGFVFPIGKEIKFYSFTIMVFSIILGVALFPINVLIAFAPGALTSLAVWLGLGAILVTYSFRSLRSISIGSRYILLHKFHFLLYLCAVEILPIIILIKFIL